MSAIAGDVHEGGQWPPLVRSVVTAVHRRSHQRIHGARDTLHESIRRRSTCFIDSSSAHHPAIICWRAESVSLNMAHLTRILTGALLLVLLDARAAVIAQDGPLTATNAAERAVLRDSLTRARIRWSARRPISYRARIEMQCECARSRDNAPWILVHGDSIVSDSLRSDQRRMVMSRPVYYTIDGLFSVLETALRDSTATLHNVRFDRTSGFPLSFNTRRICRVGPCSTGGWDDVRVFEFAIVRAGAGR